MFLIFFFFVIFSACKNLSVVMIFSVLVLLKIENNQLLRYELPTYFLYPLCIWLFRVKDVHSMHGHWTSDK